MAKLHSFCHRLVIPAKLPNRPNHVFTNLLYFNVNLHRKTCFIKHFGVKECLLTQLSLQLHNV